jgi:hypothetical protein
MKSTLCGGSSNPSIGVLDQSELTITPQVAKGTWSDEVKLEALRTSMVQV